MTQKGVIDGIKDNKVLLKINGTIKEISITQITKAKLIIEF